MVHNDVGCDNCIYLFERFTTNANRDKQAVYWIMEDMVTDPQLFRGKHLIIEYTLPSAQRIDVHILNPEKWLEYKWYAGVDKIKQTTMLIIWVNCNGE